MVYGVEDALPIKYYHYHGSKLIKKTRVSFLGARGAQRDPFPSLSGLMGNEGQNQNDDEEESMRIDQE
jgi:hypothetical protein